MTLKEFSERMNNLTPEQIAKAMERLPTDVLEFAVRFEAMGFVERARKAREEERACEN